MKTSVSSQNVANISHPTYQRLHTYALAATAAGVTMLALVPPGEAEIIYKSANLVSPFSLDVNGDGTIDFNVWMSGQTIYNFLRVNGASVAGNGVVGSFSYARALSSGAQIGPAANFVASGLMAWGMVYQQPATQGVALLWAVGRRAQALPRPEVYGRRPGPLRLGAIE